MADMALSEAPDLGYSVSPTIENHLQPPYSRPGPYLDPPRYPKIGSM